MTATMLATANAGTVVLNQLIPNTRDGGTHPHRVDILVPQVYDRFVVCMHGGGGKKERFARNLGVVTSQTITRATVSWAGLNNRQAIAVFPQGQACLGIASEWNPGGIDTRSTTNPEGVATWSNHVMWSGADDPQFLKDLSTWLQAQYPAAAAKRVLAGHSNGGMMVNRAWYEFPDSYTHYCSAAGPASIKLADDPMPATVRPFFMQIGDQDDLIGILDGRAGVGNHFEDDEWLQQEEHIARADVDFPALTSWVGELVQMQRRLTAIGGGALGDGVESLASGAGTVTKWTKALAKIVLHRLSNATHEVTSLAAADGNLFVKWAIFADF